MLSMGMQFLLREILVDKQLINKNCTINEPKLFFQDAFTDLYKKTVSFYLNIMHALGAVDIRIYLAPKSMVTQYQPRAMIFVLT